MAYTGGPWPFGYHGLGDLVCFVCFGLLAVIGTAYLESHTVTPLMILASIPVGCLVTAILVVNNLRDIDSDRQVGKKTLAVVLGRRGTRLEYADAATLLEELPMHLLALQRACATASAAVTARYFDQTMPVTWAHEGV